MRQEDAIEVVVVANGEVELWVEFFAICPQKICSEISTTGQVFFFFSTKDLLENLDNWSMFFFFFFFHL